MSVVAAIVAALATAVAPHACASNLASGLHAAQGSDQLVTVVAAGRRSTTASVRVWERSDGCLLPVAGPWRARLGRSGLARVRHEGDGTTPVGAFALDPLVYGTGPDPGVQGSYHRLVCGDWWDSDPTSPSYNRFRHVACGTRPPFAAGSEPLWTQTRPYRLFAVVEFNAHPVVPGRGSAIFVHADTGSSTSGCVSLPLPRLAELLLRLQPVAHPLIAIGTPADLRTL